jgi:predicted anti-sigma-YlaC factor YlaD
VRVVTDLSCQELVELVTEYLEGTLAPEERVRFEMHLAYCRGCDIYVDQMRETLRLMGRLTEQTLEPRARDSLLGAFRDWKRDVGPR